MIILDTSKCPIELTYERGYEKILEIQKDTPTFVRCREKDFFRLRYKNSELLIRPYPRQIKISGNMTELALGLAMLIQGTLETLEIGLSGEDIINEAFTFSKEGKINGSWLFGWDGDKEAQENMNQINEFINIYNRVYPTVLLLK